MRHSLWLATLAALATPLAQAAPVHSAGAYTACFYQAAARYHIDVQLYMAIVEGESHFRPGATHRNRDGSTDYGMAQINSSLLPALAKYGITSDDLMNDPCLNIHVGAWVFHEQIRIFGYTWRAVGGYGAGTSKKKERARTVYANRVAKLYQARMRALAKDPAALQNVAPPDAGQRAVSVPATDKPQEPQLKVF